MIHNTAVGIDPIAMAGRRPGGPHGQPGGHITHPAGTAVREEAGTLGHQQSLGDGVHAEIAFLLHMRSHGV
jgi:hypothetical protein